MDVERTVDVMGARRFFPFELASKMGKFSAELRNLVPRLTYLCFQLLTGR